LLDFPTTQKVAVCFERKHHSRTYALEEGADAVRAVVETLDACNVKTIHASKWPTRSRP